MAKLAIRFREKLVEVHGAVLIGRSSVPLHLTEAVNSRDNSIKFCDGWKVWIKDQKYLMLSYNKIVTPIVLSLIDSITIR